MSDELVIWLVVSNFVILLIIGVISIAVFVWIIWIKKAINKRKELKWIIGLLNDVDKYFIEYDKKEVSELLTQGINRCSSLKLKPEVWLYAKNISKVDSYDGFKFIYGEILDDIQRTNKFLKRMIESKDQRRK